MARSRSARSSRRDQRRAASSASNGAGCWLPLIGFLGDFELAEEAAQEAFAIAAERWPRDGTPDNPAAWLIVTARNRAINRIRRERTLAAKTRLLEVPDAAEDETEDPMDAPSSPTSGSS